MNVDEFANDMSTAVDSEEEGELLELDSTQVTNSDEQEDIKPGGDDEDDDDGDEDW